MSSHKGRSCIRGEPCSTSHLYYDTCPVCLVTLFNNGCLLHVSEYGDRISSKQRQQIDDIWKKADNETEIKYKEDQYRRATGAEKDIKRLTEKAIRNAEKAAKATERAVEKEIRDAEKVAKEAKKKDSIRLLLQPPRMLCLECSACA